MRARVRCGPRARARAPQVLHRAGLQFFEVASYAVTTGLVALVVFRSLLQRPFGTVWDFPADFPEVDSRHVLVGAPPGGELTSEGHGDKGNVPRQLVTLRHTMCAELRELGGACVCMPWSHSNIQPRAL